MKALLSLAIVLVLLGGDVFALSNFTFDKVEVHVVLDEEREGYFITLTSHEDGMEYLDFMVKEPIEAFTVSREILRTEVGAETTRIYFDHPLVSGEEYYFIMNVEGVETKTVDEYLLFNKAMVFPQPVDIFILAIELPKGTFPEIESHGVSCPEGC